ncbi:MAG: hypothetical protein JJU29_11070 [Verrucomicrobia bacterium]|nr:hypothetical protein [Verrucomicrobiota bacterium]MCH8510577.1 hypothetical protein [Kiritimatiellia bacterium]
MTKTPRKPNWNRPHPADVLAVCVLFAALALRVWAAWAMRCITEPDPAVVGLMARHMATFQDVPVFFYGQDYMGSLEPMASAVMIRLLGSSGFALNLGPVFFAMLALTFLWGCCRNATGPWGGLAGTVFSLVGPLVYFNFQIAPRGGYMVALWVITLLIFASARMAARLHMHETVTGMAKKLSWPGFFGLGLLAGVGLWSNLSVAPALAVAAILLANGMQCRFGRYLVEIFAGLIGTLIGFAPWLLYNLRNDWASLDMSQIQAREPLRQALQNAWSRFVMLQGDGQGFGGGRMPFFLTLVIIVLVGWGMFLIWKQWPKATLLQNYTRIAAVLWVFVFSIVFVTSGFTHVNSARYWVPVMPGLTILMCLTCSEGLRRCWRMAGTVALLGMISLQFGLLAPRLREQARQAPVCLEAFLEIDTALASIGADAYMAPLQLYALNFANQERIPVSDGFQTFYLPIKKAAELAQNPAFAAGFLGMEVFLEQHRAQWDSIQSGAHRILWNLRRHNFNVRILPEEIYASVTDDAGRDCRSMLLDRNLDTWWSPENLDGPRQSASLEWIFVEPQDVSLVQLVFPHEMTGNRYSFPRQIQIEAKRGGVWEETSIHGPIIPLEWSGPNVYPSEAPARLEYPVDLKGVEGFRATFFDTRDDVNRTRWRLAHIAAFAGDGDTPMVLNADDVDELGAWLRDYEPTSVVFASRWLSNQLLLRNWVPESKLAGLSARVFRPYEHPSRTGWVDPERPVVFVVEPYFAVDLRYTLTGQGGDVRELRIGPWAVFEVDAEDWDPEGLNLPPAIYWIGETLFNGHTLARADETIRRIRSDRELSVGTRAALLADLVRRRPSALSAMTEEEVLRWGGEEAANRRREFAYTPRHPSSVTFSNGIRLEGVEVYPKTLAPGETVNVRLHWTADKGERDSRDTIFIHLQDENGRIVAQSDYLLPVRLSDPNLLPALDEFVENNRQITLPANLPPGSLSLSIGIYRPHYRRRVRILESDSPEIRRQAAYWPERLRVEE